MGILRTPVASSQIEYPGTLFIAPPIICSCSSSKRTCITRSILPNPSFTDKDFLLDERAPLI